MDAPEWLLTSEVGRLGDVAVGTDGFVYLSTDNGGATKAPLETNDCVVRVMPG